MERRCWERRALVPEIARSHGRLHKVVQETENANPRKIRGTAHSLLVKDKIAQQKQTRKNFKEQTSFDLNMKYTLDILTSKIILDKKEEEKVSIIFLTLRPPRQPYYTAVHYTGTWRLVLMHSQSLSA